MATACGVAIAASVGALAFAGGGPRGGAAARAPQPAPGGARPRLAWLVPTSGPQPTVAQENRQRGTTAWRLPGPAGDVGGLAYGPISGYVAEPAVAPGQRQRIYVSAPGRRRVRIEIFRMGWYGGTGGRAVLRSASLPVVPQPPCVHRRATGLTECHWRATLSFVIPAGLPSGVYIAKLSSRATAADCLFVVLAAHSQPLLAQLPSSTYEAYNDWGGDSLYPGGERVGITGATQAVAVSYDRPYDTVTGAGEFFSRDVAMVRFLERYGYPVSYTSSEAVDDDPGQLLHHRAVIDFGHSEYWSERQRRGLAAALRAGVSLLLFGSDTMAWRVRYTLAAGEPGRPGHAIVAYKQYAARDPDRADPTGLFADGGAPLTGSAYVGCITPRLPVRGPPVYRYYAWAPDPARAPRWLFARTGITAATRLPGIVGYELDRRTLRSPPGARVIGAGAAACMEAPEPGGPVFRGRFGLAETTLYAGPSAAIGFNSGTLGWELGLQPVPSASPDALHAPEPALVALTRNLLAYVLR